MTCLRLNAMAQLCALVMFVACGSSNGHGGLASGSDAAVGGSGAVIGSSSLGGASAAGNGTANGTNTNGGLPGNGTSNSGQTTAGTGSSATDGAGGDGNTQGGDGSSLSSVGGSGLAGFGGGSTVDVKVTGGSGNSVDVSTGGSGNSVDVATGGSGWTIDIATGGGASIDIATGGGASIDKATGGGSSIDKATGGGSSIDLGTGGGTSVDIPNCIKTDLNNVNVYVITDVTNKANVASDCEGNMYVGGTFYSAVGYSIGGVNLVTGDKCSQYSFVAAGDVSGAMVNNGKAAAAGTVTNSQAGCGGFPRMTKAQLPVNFDSLSAKFQNLSVALAKLPSSPGTSVTRNAGGALVLKGTDPVQNVFNIDGSQLGSLTLDVPLTSVVIVNVAGTTISWPGGGMTLPGATGGVNGDYLFSSNVLWNFPSATKFYMNGLAIHGTVLAPLATFDASGSGHVAGQVIVYAMTGLAIEFHPYYFMACITWPKAG